MKKDAYFVAVVVVLFLLLPSCSFAGGGVEPLTELQRPTWRVGDIRIYQRSLDGKPVPNITLRVIEITEEGYTVEVESDGKKTQEFYNKDLNFLRAKNAAGRVIENCGVGMPTFKWPARPGDEWSGSYWSSSEYGSSNEMTLRVKVEKAETLINADGKEIATLKYVFKRENQNRRFLGSREYWCDSETGYIVKRVDKREGIRENEVRKLIHYIPGKIN